MIIVQLTGGLGNQMFQYAAAKCLAHRNKVKLGLDISFFKKDHENVTKRYFELSHFNIDAHLLSDVEVDKICSPPKSLLERIWWKVFPSKTFFAERHFHFDPNFFKIKDNTYISGYWQSEKYFQEIDYIIKKEFNIQSTEEDRQAELVEMATITNSVSIHIRRGDYAKNLATQKIHGLCDIEYYRKSLQKIEQNSNNPTLFIFSDDIEWAKENLSFPHPMIFVDHNDAASSHKDMMLMSMCKHNIIANSTFSWWAAWLNKNPAKVVCAPKNWFNIKKYDTKDLIPKEWHRI